LFIWIPCLIFDTSEARSYGTKHKAMSNSTRIQNIKHELVACFDSYATSSQANDGLEVVLTVRDEAKGFAADVAATVGSKKRCSEKQAFIIASAFVENNMTSRSSIGAVEADFVCARQAARDAKEEAELDEILKNIK